MQDAPRYAAQKKGRYSGRTVKVLAGTYFFTNSMRQIGQRQSSHCPNRRIIPQPLFASVTHCQGRSEPQTLGRGPGRLLIRE